MKADLKIYACHCDLYFMVHSRNTSSMWCDDQPQNIFRSVFHVAHRFALKFIEGYVIYIQTHKTYSAKTK